MQLCVTPYLVTHRTPGTRQQELGWYKCSSRLDPRPGAGLPVAMGPAISGCIYLRVFPWSVQYSTVQYSTVHGLCSLHSYSVWPGYGGGRGACDS